MPTAEVYLPLAQTGRGTHLSTSVEVVVAEGASLYLPSRQAVHTAFDDAVLAADVYVPGPHMLVERQAVRSMTTLEVDRPALNLPDGQALHVGCVLQAPTVAV